MDDFLSSESSSSANLINISFLKMSILSPLLFFVIISPWSPQFSSWLSLTPVFSNLYLSSAQISPLSFRTVLPLDHEKCPYKCLAKKKKNQTLNNHNCPALQFIVSLSTQSHPLVSPLPTPDHVVKHQVLFTLFSNCLLNLSMLLPISPPSCLYYWIFSLIYPIFRVI